MNQDKIIHIYGDIFEHVFFAFFFVYPSATTQLEPFFDIGKRILRLKISS